MAKPIKRVSDEDFKEAFGVYPHEVETGKYKIDKYGKDLRYVDNDFREE